MTFFAGADHLFSSIMNMLDPGTEPTEQDFNRLTQIHDELDRFKKQFAAKVMPTKGEA